jgi:EAL domain-containing protein (putative c-di-GMP-specific phosphodiesterase class I)
MTRSSRSHLRSCRFDVIKIDRSIVLDLCEHSGSREIVHAIVALANSLGMTTTAEGVETPEHLAELRRQGCTNVQGFLLSRPLQAADAMRLLSRATTTDIAAA